MGMSEIDDLIRLCATRGPEAEVADGARSVGEMSRESFVDAFSRRVEQQYSSGGLTLEAADAAMKRLGSLLGF